MRTVNLVSVSGGKDSTATLLLALERNVDNLQAVFADTGHEHPAVYDYLEYLESSTGVKIQKIKADFSQRIATRKQNLINFLLWVSENQSMKFNRLEGWVLPAIERALPLMKPTGNPFLDLCLLKGRFPSTTKRFCTEELKVFPIQNQVIWPLLRDPDVTIESWQGIRWDESAARANAVEREGIEPDAQRVFAYRPILSWTANDVFDFHKRHNVKWNPLYELGMGRVGCMPCVNCRKDELREISQRFPEEIERIAEWEHLVSLASKMGSGTFFSAIIDPTANSTDDISPVTHGIHRAVDWAKTTRGGRQYDLIAAVNTTPQQCSSIYGLCEQ